MSGFQIPCTYLIFYCFLYSLFSQYRFFVAGIGLGTAYHLHSKAGPAPMIVAGLGGSLADLIYGYTVECQKEVQAYNNQPKEN